MEALSITSKDKAQIYKELIPQIAALLEGENNEIANMANICAALKETFGWLWVGFYIRKGEQLVLGPFQGPIACTRIQIGKGVCGTAAEKQETIIVPNVDEFPGHIACSSLSKSEIVVPLIRLGETKMVLDADSAELNAFNEIDQVALEQIVSLL